MVKQAVKSLSGQLGDRIILGSSYIQGHGLGLLYASSTGQLRQDLEVSMSPTCPIWVMLIVEQGRAENYSGHPELRFFSVIHGGAVIRLQIAENRPLLSRPVGSASQKHAIYVRLIQLWSRIRVNIEKSAGAGKLHSGGEEAVSHHPNEQPRGRRPAKDCVRPKKRSDSNPEHLGKD